MYCCISAGPRVDYLPPGVVPLIPGAKRKHWRVRFTGETELVQAEKTQFEKGNSEQVMHYGSKMSWLHQQFNSLCLGYGMF